MGSQKQADFLRFNLTLQSAYCQGFHVSFERKVMLPGPAAKHCSTRNNGLAPVVICCLESGLTISKGSHVVCYTAKNADFLASGRGNAHMSLKGPKRGKVRAWIKHARQAWEWMPHDSLAVNLRPRDHCGVQVMHLESLLSWNSEPHRRHSY